MNRKQQDQMELQAEALKENLNILGAEYEKLRQERDDLVRGLAAERDARDAADLTNETIRQQMNAFYSQRGGREEAVHTWEANLDGELGPYCVCVSCPDPFGINIYFDEERENVVGFIITNEDGIVFSGGLIPADLMMREIDHARTWG